MPRHPEGLIRWVLDVQVAMTDFSLGDFGFKEEAGGAPTPAQPPSATPSARSGA